MFQISFTPEAIDDLRSFRKYDQQRIIDEIESQLPEAANQETRHRKRLRPNLLAEWELRVGDFRVFYNVNEEELRATILAIGIKQGNKLFVHGEEFEL
jgi:mRNA-degrading endonuclease RelE of RelBE toxin-antitoxin system